MHNPIITYFIYHPARWLNAAAASLELYFHGLTLYFHQTLVPAILSPSLSSSPDFMVSQHVSQKDAPIVVFSGFGLGSLQSIHFPVFGLFFTVPLPSMEKYKTRCGIEPRKGSDQAVSCFRWLTGSLPPARAMNNVGGGHSPPHEMTYRLTAICKLCRSTAVRYGCP